MIHSILHMTLYDSLIFACDSGVICLFSHCIHMTDSHVIHWFSHVTHFSHLILMWFVYFHMWCSHESFVFKRDSHIILVSCVILMWFISHTWVSCIFYLCSRVTRLFPYLTFVPELNNKSNTENVFYSSHHHISSTQCHVFHIHPHTFLT